MKIFKIIKIVDNFGNIHGKITINKNKFHHPLQLLQVISQDFILLPIRVWLMLMGILDLHQD